VAKRYDNGRQSGTLFIVPTHNRSLVNVIVRPLSTVGYTSVASVIHCRRGLTIIIHDRSSEGSVTQLHACSVFWKTPLFIERKYTLLGSKVAGQGVGATKAYRRKPTIERRE